MKALFFNPYLDVLGGGELYTLSWLKYLTKKGYKVELAWFDEGVLKKTQERFNLNLKDVKVNPLLYLLFKNEKSLRKKYAVLKNYDFIFYLSDGSVPFLFGKKNYLHFQVPFTKWQDFRLIKFLKFKLITKVICNSLFTKSFIDKTYGINSGVVYPYAQGNFFSGAKKNYILSVGRFDNTINQKKQEILIKTFKSLSKKAKDWQLILAGGSRDEKKIKDLQNQSEGSAVKIIPNTSFDDLKKLYAEAKIYWQATGFGEDLKSSPEKAEHFGIAVVEAMAAGVVPVIFNGGGLKEIVSDKKNGFLFNSLSELEALTLNLIKNEKERQVFSLSAKERAKNFGEENFFKNIEKTLSND